MSRMEVEIMDALYFDTMEASRRFGIPARTFIFWREKRRGPVYYRVGRNLVLYKAEDIESYIAALAVRPEGNETGGLEKGPLAMKEREALSHPSGTGRSDAEGPFSSPMGQTGEFSETISRLS